MSEIRYVTLDPTGNTTCLVLDPIPLSERPAVTEKLMTECEQVGYLVPAGSPGAEARLEMMGGEFCGNATMATACWLARENGILPGEERTVTLEVSGADKTLRCTVRALDDGFEGTVEMPGALEIFKTEAEGLTLMAVRMEGIIHLIVNGKIGTDAQAERMLRKLADGLPDDAAGLLQWDGEYMRPLVYVRNSGTMVWETGCGSGSTAIGLLRAWESGRETTETVIRQPGGTIRVLVGRDGAVTMTGKVRIK